MNIEEIIKSSLQNSEMPFDPKAWEAMSSRLDQAMPVSTPKTSYTWAWVASIAVVAGISAFFFINRENQDAVTKHQISTITTPESKPEKTAAATEGKAVDNKFHQAATADRKQATAQTSNDANRQGHIQAGASSAGPIAPLKGSTVNNGGTAATGIIATTPKDARPFVFTAPKVNDRYCENEKVSFKNPNDFAISLVSENGSTYYADGGKTLSAELTEAGDYYFVYKNNGKTEKENAFKVQAKPKADFYTNNETVYKNGLPVNELEASYPAKEYTWLNARGEVISRDKAPDVHLFTKGQHEITLKVENANGCTSQITKTVRCEVSYNLLAVTGFNPESMYRDNKTFIPYALLDDQRNIPFEMEIVDPKTGQTVYKTKNANEPWDGIDMNTRQMVQPGSTFIWKVTIYKKEIGEPKNVYQGTITRI